MYSYYHLSSTSLTTSGTDAIVASVKYFPFGVCRNSQGILDTDKLFTGQRLDDTGLYYYNARYYDATIGRFVSADAIVPDYMNPQTLNRYSYCNNNPLKYTDPSGHNAFTDFFTKTIPDLFSNAWETVKGWSQAVRDTLDWVLADKSASERGEDIKAQAKFYWENRDWVISSVADIGITVMGGYGVAAFGKSFIKGAVAKGARGGEAGVAREFWSGGSRAEQAATYAAVSEGGMTVGMTRTGQILNRIEPYIGQTATEALWKTRSAFWALTTRSEVNVFIDYSMLRPNSIWNTIEKPILNWKGIKINYYDVTP